MTGSRKVPKAPDAPKMPLIDRIPFAVQHPSQMITRGRYAEGWPRGAIVHHTAGRNTKGKAFDTISGGIKNGYTYLCIDIDGTLVQAHPVSRWGYHAGKSAWKGFGGGLNDDCIGIEICSPGLLTKEKDGTLKAYWGEIIPREKARFVTYEQYGCPTGWYARFSPEQEKTLLQTLHWLKEQGGGVFSYENVLGHHEVAGLKGLGYWRKNDPGGCLSVPMDVLRQLLLTGGTI